MESDGEVDFWRRTDRFVAKSITKNIIFSERFCTISSTRSVRVDRRFEVGSESEAGVPHSCHAYQDINWSQ